MKKVVPSQAQAKLIARLWSEDRSVPIMVGATEGISVYVDATCAALVKHKWVSPAGIEYHQNNRVYVDPRVTDTGLDALEMFLFKQRMKRP